MSDTPVTPTPPAHFKPKDAAAYLTISPRKLWEETNRGRVKAARIGRRLIYPRTELDRYVALLIAAA